MTVETPERQRIKKEGAIFNSNNYGEFVILKYNSFNDILIKFLSTGYKKTVSSKAIYSGSIKDVYFPSVFGKGFIGEGRFTSKSSVPNKNNRAYTTWQSMLGRCYNLKNKRSEYEGCEVENSWLNFQNFAKWDQDNYPKDGRKYELDKDIVVQGNKTYGEDFCKYVSKRENVQKAIAKYYKMVDPSGECVDIYNMFQFCKDKDLCFGGMSRVVTGSRPHYKGWTLPKDDDE